MAAEAFDVADAARVLVQLKYAAWVRPPLSPLSSMSSMSSMSSVSSVSPRSQRLPPLKLTLPLKASAKLEAHLKAHRKAPSEAPPRPARRVRNSHNSNANTLHATRTTHDARNTRTKRRRSPSNFPPGGATTERDAPAVQERVQERAQDREEQVHETWPGFARRVSRACGGLAFTDLGPFASELKARLPMSAWTAADIACAFADWQARRRGSAKAGGGFEKFA